MRIPRHIGVIPDGNRRWAKSQGMTKDKGYSYGIDPGYKLFKLCEKEGVEEVTFYGFTTDNTKRPEDQKKAFIDACIKSVNVIAKENAEILVVGNTTSELFPRELTKYTKRVRCGKGGIKVNFLINYSWKKDLESLSCGDGTEKSLNRDIISNDISRIDMIIRWGGRRRLSGFLPIQSVYSDFYVIDEYWPDFQEKQFYDALDWYQTQDITLGG